MTESSSTHHTTDAFDEEEAGKTRTIEEILGRDDPAADKDALDDAPTSRPVPDGVTDDVLTLYFTRIGEVDLLTREEEVELAKMIEAGKTAERELQEITDLSPEAREELHTRVQQGKEARSYFIEANTRLVVSVAKAYRNYGLPFQDLIQAGNIGLIRAVDKFDHEMGNRFSTYAMWWIRQSIKRALTQQGYTIRLPYYLRSRLHRIRETTRRLEKQLGRDPTIEELAEALGEEDADRLQQLLQISRHTVSLNTPVGDEEESELLQLIEDENAPSPAETVQAHLMHEELEAVMRDVLTEREIHILAKRFGLKGERRHTLQELADDLDLSRERIRQIERKALRKLRHPYHRRRLLSYLR